jgi:HEAT repeat protein
MSALADACGHTDPTIRVQAAVTLSQLASGRALYTAARFRPDRLDSVTEFVLGCGREDIPGLIANLSDPRLAVRRATAEALGMFFGVAESAIPALTKLLEEPDEGVSKAAAKALKKINEYEDSLKPPIRRHGD